MIDKMKKSLPKNWDTILSRVSEYRSRHIAAVDTMGCDALHMRWVNDKSVPPPVKRYRTLIALMLSSQTKDEHTSHAILSLVADNGLSPASITKISESNLNKLIFSVGFHNRKATFIKQATARVVAEHGGDVPNDLGYLLGLPGVGPKMAHLFLQIAYNQVEGISVDVHMHRIFPLWGWVPATSTTPEHVRKALEEWLPKEHWRGINPLVVGFGQTMCIAQRPRCAECPLRDVCPSVDYMKKSVKREVKVKRERSPEVGKRTSSPPKKEKVVKGKRETSPEVQPSKRAVKTMVKVKVEPDIEDW